jgi:hypothetical protein
MNYIITESKLDNIIDNFITTQFGKLHHQLDGDKFTLVNDNGFTNITTYLWKNQESPHFPEVKKNTHIN